MDLTNSTCLSTSQLGKRNDIDIYQFISVTLTLFLSVAPVLTTKRKNSRIWPYKSILIKKQHCKQQCLQYRAENQLTRPKPMTTLNRAFFAKWSFCVTTWFRGHYLSTCPIRSWGEGILYMGWRSTLRILYKNFGKKHWGSTCKIFKKLLRKFWGTHGKI